MALYAFDGTGNEDKPDTDKGGFDSNVLHFFRAYEDPAKDVDPPEEEDRKSTRLNSSHRL